MYNYRLYLSTTDSCISAPSGNGVTNLQGVRGSPMGLTPRWLFLRVVVFFWVRSRASGRLDQGKPQDLAAHIVIQLTPNSDELAGKTIVTEFPIFRVEIDLQFGHIDVQYRTDSQQIGLVRDRFSAEPFTGRLIAHAQCSRQRADPRRLHR